MNEDSTLFSISPNAYAEYLEHLTDEEFWDHAFAKAHATHPTSALATIAAPTQEYLACATCQLRNERYILPLAALHEIVPVPQHVTFLPDVPLWMLGIVSWRGETVAAIDLEAYLAKSEAMPLGGRNLLIAHHDELLMAFCVSFIEPIINVDATQITFFEESRYLSSEVPVGIRGIWEPKDKSAQNGDMLVLDVPTLFNDVLRHLEKKTTHE